MAETTYLRAIRLKYGISLLELERHSSLSNQYLSALELGNAKRTERNERLLCCAMEEVISSRERSLGGLRETLLQYQGRLLEAVEADSDAGRVMGLFELRNLVEAVVLTIPVLYLCIAFLPFALSTKIMVTLVTVVPVGGFGLIGVNDDSMTRWLEDWWRWRRRRRIILFRGEVRK